MSTLSFLVPVVPPAERTAAWYPDAAVQWRLLVVLLASLAGVVGSFVLENEWVPWRARMEAATPGWSFVLSQAAVFGFATALAIRGQPAAVAQALLAATLLGYAYVLAGSALIDGRRAVQYAHLIFRAVELGLVGVAAMILGASVRLLARQRLALGEQRRDTSVHYSVVDLMFLTLVFALGMWLVNLFFNYRDRDSQLAEVLLAIVRALPAALPWLWGMTQSRLSPKSVLAIIGTSLVVWAIKTALEYQASGEVLGGVMYGMGLRAVAYAGGASVGGLMLRGLGFRWSAG